MHLVKPVKQVITARIDVENYEWLKAAAAKQERSANWLLGKLIQEARFADEHNEGRENDTMQ